MREYFSVYQNECSKHVSHSQSADSEVHQDHTLMMSVWPDGGTSAISPPTMSSLSSVTSPNSDGDRLTSRTVQSLSWSEHLFSVIWAVCPQLPSTKWISLSWCAAALYRGVSRHTGPAFTRPSWNWLCWVAQVNSSTTWLIQVQNWDQISLSCE